MHACIGFGLLDAMHGIFRGHTKSKFARLIPRQAHIDKFDWPWGPHRTLAARWLSAVPYSQPAGRDYSTSFVLFGTPRGAHYERGFAGGAFSAILRSESHS